MNSPDSKAIKVRYEIINESADGQRIDNFLMRQCKGVPKSRLYKILRSGEVRVDGARIGPSFRLSKGQRVRIPPIRVAEDRPRVVPQGKAFTVIYEDESMLVIDKPAGKAVHGGSGVSFGVIEQLRAQRPQAHMLELVHRLDRETSGLLMIAKKRAALKKLHQMMREGQVRKCYTTLVAGAFPDALRHLKSSLLKYVLPDGERRVCVHAEGKPAHSIVRKIQAWPHYSLLSVELKTGRTHQIRVHLMHAGYPLCGDDKYGDFALNKRLQGQGLQRMFLHASTLSFVHPLEERRVELNAPLPEELAAFIDNLNEMDGTDDEE